MNRLLSVLMHHSGAGCFLIQGLSGGDKRRDGRSREGSCLGRADCEEATEENSRRIGLFIDYLCARVLQFELFDGVK